MKKMGALSMMRRFDDGGREVGIADIDQGYNAGEGKYAGGFDPENNPEMGGFKGSATDPNVTSGLIEAMNDLAGGRTLSGHLMDFLLGDRQLDFDPESGQFTASRDWGRTAIEKGAPMLFGGPMGMIVGLGMRAGNKWGEGDPGDYDRAHGLGHARDNGRSRYADGGAEVQQEQSGPAATGPTTTDPSTPPVDTSRQLKRYIPRAGDYAHWGLTGTYPGYDVETIQLARGGSPQRLYHRNAPHPPSGLIQGLSPGRADAVDSRLPRGSYILPADVVAAEGGGNTPAGALTIARRFTGGRMATLPTVQSPGGVPARTSHGEVFLAPKDVEGAGGPDRLDNYVKTTRKRFINKLSNLPGPKK